jgi:hypothetical protein
MYSILGLVATLVVGAALGLALGGTIAKDEVAAPDESKCTCPKCGCACKGE